MGQYILPQSGSLNKGRIHKRNPFTCLNRIKSRPKRKVNLQYNVNEMIKPGQHCTELSQPVHFIDLLRQSHRTRMDTGELLQSKLVTRHS